MRQDQSALTPIPSANATKASSIPTAPPHFSSTSAAPRPGARICVTARHLPRKWSRVARQACSLHARFHARYVLQVIVSPSNALRMLHRTDHVDEHTLVGEAQV